MGVSDLLKRVQSGDRRAFDSLVEEESRYLRCIAFRITRDRGLAEDVVQDVFVRVFEGR